MIARMILAVLCALMPAAAMAQRAIPTSDLIFFVAPPASGGICTPSGTWGASGAGAVSACGSDTFGNGSTTAPYATPQRCFDHIYQDFDLQFRFGAKCQLAVAPSGGVFTYPGIRLSGRAIGQAGAMQPLVASTALPTIMMGLYKPLVLQGDPNLPNNALIAPGTNGFPAQQALSMIDGASVRLYGLRVDTGEAGFACIDHFNSTYLELDTIVFGNCGSVSGSESLGIGQGWKNSGLMITGPIAIVGDMSAFFQGGGWIYGNNNGMQGNAINIATYNPTIREAWWICDNCYAYMVNMILNGTFKGATRSMVVLHNGTVETGHGTTPTSCPDSYFPGSGGGQTVTVQVQDNAVCR